MKFSLARKGKRAERPCSFPIEGEGGQFQDLACALVPLTGTEETEALRFGREHALVNKAEPRPGEPLFDLGYQAQVIAIAARDPDEGEPGKRPPTFASGQEVLDGLSRETILYVYELADAWCDECSPLSRAKSDAEMFAITRRLSDEEGDKASRFFDGLGPATRKRCALFMARLLWPSLAQKFSSGGTTTSDTTGTPSTPTPPSSSPSPEKSGST